MTKIYDQHKAAFANVSAYIVLNSANERVASIAFKLPKDGAGRLYVYVHWFGVEMVRGFASGYGYDKKTAACAVAARLIPDRINGNRTPGETAGEREAFIDALGKDGGHYWDRELENRGFKVFQAV